MHEKDTLETTRFEIHEVMDLLKQSTSMIWTAYGVFFTVNTLLATGYGFLLGYGGQIPNNFSTSILLILALCGIFISYCAYTTIRLISDVQYRLHERGSELDRQIGTRIFEMIPLKGVGYPWGTVIGSFIFSVLWAVGAGHALSRFLSP